VTEKVKEAKKEYIKMAALGRPGKTLILNCYEVKP